MMPSEIALRVNELDIPRAILHGYGCDFYQLDVVTNEYTYYVLGDTLLMMNTQNHNIISDNAFAEIGYWESMENVQNGNEILLFGNFPKDN